MLILDAQMIVQLKKQRLQLNCLDREAPADL